LHPHSDLLLANTLPLVWALALAVILLVRHGVRGAPLALYAVTQVVALLLFALITNAHACPIDTISVPRRNVGSQASLDWSIWRSGSCSRRNGNRWPARGGLVAWRADWHPPKPANVARSTTLKYEATKPSVGQNAQLLKVT
jgi:hypothetical protein